jgi:multiple sugar transport system substrate-binding protein
MMRRKFSRREFLKTAGLSGAGLTVAGLASCAAPATAVPTAVPTAAPTAVPAPAKTDTLKLLLVSHFVKGYDDWIKQFASDWGQANGVKVTVDFMTNLEVAARGATEVAAQKGHDIVQWDQGTASPFLWKNHTVDLTEVVSEVEAEYGEFSALAHQAGLDPAEGTWFSLPIFYTASPALYRKDLWDEIGMQPDTWDAVLEGGRKLKEMGYPIGIPVSHGTDGNVQWSGLIWSFGGSVQDQDQRVSINTPEVVEAVKFARTLYKEAMTEEVLTWDDTGNNKFLASGVGSWIINPPSAYRSIQGTDEALADKIFAWKAPEGPKSRLMGVVPHSWTIWKFSQNQVNAVEFMRYFVANYKTSFETSTGYNMPMNPGWLPQPMPILSSDPTSHPDDKLSEIQSAPEWCRTFGYPGPNSPAIGEVAQTYVIPDMILQAATDKLTPEEAVTWADEQVQRIFRKWQA